MTGALHVLPVLCLAAFGGVLLQDDFDDGNADGWHEISMVNYDVVQGMYRMYGGYEENHGISFNGDDSGYMSTPDYSAVCRMIPETGVFFGMMCRFSEDSDYNIMIILSHQHQRLMIFKWDWYGIYVLDDVPFSVQLFQEYWLRCEVQGDVFRGRAWTGGLSAEPTDWMVQAADSLSVPGSIALFCVGLPYDLVSLSCRFDDVTVTDVSSVLTGMTWAGVKTAAAR